MKLSITAISIPVVLYLGVCLLLYSRQRALLYYPTPESVLRVGESIRLESAGETLHLRRVNPGRPRAILYFGGNGEDVAQAAPDLAPLFPGHTLYFVHYRGYGGSTGSPSEAGLFEDARNVYDHVRADHESVSAVGRSLGSGVAIHLASQRALDRLVLVTPYDSIEALARRAMPWLPISLLLRDKYRSIELAPGIETPTLVLIAGRDEVIPRSSTDRLVAAFDPRRVETFTTERAEHNTIGDDPKYLEELRRFLDGGEKEIR
jgi:pimeloyl-ACP methyl ester carboxylesterase